METQPPSEPFRPDFSEGAETGLYLALLELIDEGLILTSDETILEANTAACRLLERDYRDLIRQPLANLFLSDKEFLQARARWFIQGQSRGSIRMALPPLALLRLQIPPLLKSGPHRQLIHKYPP